MALFAVLFDPRSCCNIFSRCPALSVLRYPLICAEPNACLSRIVDTKKLNVIILPSLVRSRSKKFCMMPDVVEGSCSVQAGESLALSPSMWRQTERALVSVRYEVNISGIVQLSIELV